MAKKNEQNVGVKKVIQEEGTILVTRTTVVSGKEIPEERSQEITKIKVRPFLCQPAYASIKIGETVPLVQPYAGRRIDVNVSHPCYKEELPQVLRGVADLVDNFLEEELLKVEGAAVPRKKKTITKEDKKKTPKRTPQKKKPKVEEERDELDDLLMEDSPKEGVSPEESVDVNINEEDDDLAALL